MPAAWEARPDNLVRGSGVKVVYDARRGKERVGRGGAVHMSPKPRTESARAEWAHDLLYLVTLATRRAQRKR